MKFVKVFEIEKQVLLSSKNKCDKAKECLFISHASFEKWLEKKNVGTLFEEVK